MAVKQTFGELLDAVDALPDEDQTELIEIIQNRKRERRREQLLQDVEEARQEFADGKCRVMTVEEIMREIRE